MPGIKLKYFTTPSEEERKKNTQETDIICAQCGNKVAVLGSINKLTGETVCDVCAIKNYRYVEGFKTIKAAEAHRRRLFDVGYLFTEVLVDDYLKKHNIASEENLSVEERQSLFEISNDLQNMIPRSKKIELQNTINQAKIDRYYRRLIEQQTKVPNSRLDKY